MRDNDWIVEYEIEASLDTDSEVTSTVLYLHNNLQSDELTVFYGDGTKAGVYNVYSEGIDSLDDLSEERNPSNYDVQNVLEAAADLNFNELFEKPDIGDKEISCVYRRVIRSSESLLKVLKDSNTGHVENDRDRRISEALNHDSIDVDISDLQDDYGEQ